MRSSSPFFLRALRHLLRLPLALYFTVGLPRGCRRRSFCHQAVCTEAGMFALRERRIHVTQEDFEMSVAKVMKKDSDMNMSIRKLWK